MTTRLRDTLNRLRDAPTMARGAMIAFGLRSDPLAHQAVAQAVDWQDAVLRIAAVSDVDHRVIYEEVRGLGRDQLDTIYRRICEGQEPHVVIADVREQWKKHR